MAWRQLSLWVDEDGKVFQYGLEEFGGPVGETQASWALVAGRGKELDPEQALDYLMAEPWQAERQALWVIDGDRERF